MIEQSIEPAQRSRNHTRLDSPRSDLHSVKLKAHTTAHADSWGHGLQVSLISLSAGSFSDLPPTPPLPLLAPSPAQVRGLSSEQRCLLPCCRCCIFGMQGPLGCMHAQLRAVPHVLQQPWQCHTQPHQPEAHPQQATPMPFSATLLAPPTLSCHFCPQLRCQQRAPKERALLPHCK